MIPEKDDDLFSAPVVQPRRLGRRTVIGWIILALIVFGTVTALLLWVAHQISQVAV